MKAIGCCCIQRCTLKSAERNVTLRHGRRWWVKAHSFVMFLCATGQHMKKSKQSQQCVIYISCESNLENKKQKTARLIWLKKLKWLFFLITDTKDRWFIAAVVQLWEKPNQRRWQPAEEPLSVLQWSGAQLAVNCVLSGLHWSNKCVCYFSSQGKDG